MNIKNIISKLINKVPAKKCRIRLANHEAFGLERLVTLILQKSNKELLENEQRDYLDIHEDLEIDAYEKIISMQDSNLCSEDVLAELVYCAHMIETYTSFKFTWRGK